jgi:hypothetical protein
VLVGPSGISEELRSNGEAGQAARMTTDIISGKAFGQRYTGFYFNLDEQSPTRVHSVLFGKPASLARDLDVAVGCRDWGAPNGRGPRWAIL